MEDTTDQFVVFPVTLRRVRNAILFRGVFDCVKSFAQLSLKSNFKSDRLYTVASSWPSAAPRDDIVNESKELWLSVKLWQFTLSHQLHWHYRTFT